MSSSFFFHTLSSFTYIRLICFFRYLYTTTHLRYNNCMKKILHQPKKQIILASASPRRAELLAQIGLPFTIKTSDAPEICHATEPEAIVMELSRQKAAAVRASYDGDTSNLLFIGADTLVFLDQRQLGKPKDAEAAKQMLRELSGGRHHVYTGVTLLCEEASHSFYEVASVDVCELSDEEIAAYVATGDPLDKAGAYGIQGAFAAYIKGISGDYNTIVGLPICRLYQEMKRLSYL